MSVWGRGRRREEGVLEGMWWTMGTHLGWKVATMAREPSPLLRMEVVCPELPSLTFSCVPVWPSADPSPSVPCDSLVLLGPKRTFRGNVSE